MWKISYKIWPFSESNSLCYPDYGESVVRKGWKKSKFYHYIPNLLGAQLIKKCGSDDTAENREGQGDSTSLLRAETQTSSGKAGPAWGQTVIRPAPEPGVWRPKELTSPSLWNVSPCFLPYCLFLFSFKRKFIAVIPVEWIYLIKCPKFWLLCL